MMEFAARKLDRGFVLASSSPQRGEGGPQGRMRGAEGHLCWLRLRRRPPHRLASARHFSPLGRRGISTLLPWIEKTKVRRRQVNGGHGGVTRGDLATPQRNILYVPLKQKPPAPIAVSAVASLPKSTTQAKSASRATPIIQPISDGSVPRVRRSPKPSLSTAVSFTRR